MKSLREKRSQKMIDAMFDGLEDDHLKVVMEVLYGLKDETSLDEFRRMNEQNLEDIKKEMELTEAVSIPVEITELKPTDNITYTINGNDTTND